MSKLKNILVFASGLCTGAIASVIILKKKYEKEAQEEINSVKLHYGKMYRESTGLKMKDEKENIDDTTKKENIDDTTKKENIIHKEKTTHTTLYNNYYDTNYHTYSSIANDYLNNHAKENDLNIAAVMDGDINTDDSDETKTLKQYGIYDNDGQPLYKFSGDEKRPYRVTQDQFDNAEPLYDKVDMVYYDDNVVVDSAGDVLTDEDIDMFIGKETLLFFKPETDVIYVKNEALKTYFEVIAGRTCYYDNEQ